MTKRSIETEIVHAGERRPLPEGLPNSTPLFTSSSYSYASMADADRIFTGESDGFIYSRYGNPTVKALQESVRMLDGGAAARTFGSGMAAIHAALLTCDLTPGSVILASRDLYGATFALTADIFKPFGVETVQADFGNIDELKSMAAEVKPRAFVGETISNPLLKVLDIPAVADVAHGVGAKLVVDSTFASPYLSRPLELGADIVVHSATKYLSGHGDAMGGVVIVRDAADERQLTRAMRLAGGILSPWEAHQISRGVHTLALRMDKQCSNAEKLAEALSKNPRIAKVHFPKFGDADLAERMLKSGFYGALVSIVLADDTREAAWRFMDSLELCVRATTLGDVFTTVSHSATSSHRELSDQRRAELGITEGLVRISVGIENVNDILADIEQALEK